MNGIARCIAEQAECAAYLRGDGPNKEGAMRGLEDWIMEEAILRTELPKPYYEHAGITIYHGDCREILPHLSKVDFVLTDPPYGIGFAAQPTKWQRRAGQMPEEWDGATVDIAPVLNAGEICIIWGGNYYALPPSRGWLCWYKPDAPPSMGSFELAWTNQDRNSRLIVHSISATNAERVGHPTQKPLAVILWSMGQFDGEAILDPFMGSGTTLVAAKQLGRRAIGIEIEERHCEIAAKRLEQEVFDFGPAPEETPEQMSILECEEGY